MSTENDQLQTTSGQAYLDKDFSVELNFKLWTTKGSRFIASHRLKTINKWSTYSIGFISAYLIILGLLTVFGFDIDIDSKKFAFISTGLSILILVFSQLEGANDYRLRAEKFHDCALEIGDLYNRLRYIKTSDEGPKEINKKSADLAKEYGILLKRYENHRLIDFGLFQTTKNDYFKLKPFSIFVIKVKYYIETLLFYHALIVVPPIFIYLLLQ